MVQNTTEEQTLKKSTMSNDWNNIPKNSFASENASNSIWFSKRFLVAIMVLLGFTNTTMLLSNVNIAVVEMTSNKTITIGNISIVRPAEFQWDTVTISMVSSIVFYGGLFVVFGGYFVDKLGGSVSCTMSMMVAGVLTILQPATLHLDFHLFLACRFVTGFFLNLFFICTAEINSRWYPKKERSTLIAIGYNGVNVGVAIGYPLFGYIADKSGWPMVFYVSGIISVVISLIYMVLVKNHPSQDEWISKEELDYILHGTDDASRKEEPHPYIKILTSAPVLALCIGKFTLLWINTALGTSLPLYVKDLTGKSTDEIGIISSIPTDAKIIMFPIAGALLDGWKNTRDIDLTQMHKMTIRFVYLLSSVCFIATVLFNNFIISMIFFVIIDIFMTAVPSVLEPIIVNISPNDSCVVAGLAKFVSSIGAIACRTCVGYMTINHSSREWNNFFLLTACVLFFGALIFLKFASSEAQPWSSTSPYEQERDPLMKIKHRRISSINSKLKINFQIIRNKKASSVTPTTFSE